MEGFLLILTLVSSGLVFSVTGFQQSVHSNLTQTASVGCVLADNLTLTFFLDTGSDFIGAVYLVNASDPSDTTQSTFSVTTGDIQGSGTPSDLYTFSVVAQKANKGLFIVSPESLKTKAEIIETNVLSVHVLVKSNNSFSSLPFMKDFIFAEDVLYVATCNASDIQDYVVTAGKIEVTGDVQEAVTGAMGLADIYIQDSQNRSIQEGAIGDIVTLYIIPYAPNTFAPGEGYMHSCFVCGSSDCQSSFSMELIDLQGCSTGYVSPVKVEPKVGFGSEFALFKPRDQPFMFFQCRVGFCQYENDTKCADYCAYNRARGPRNRRDVNTEEDVSVSTFIRVTGEPDKQASSDNLIPELMSNQAANVAKQQQNTVILGTVIALATLLFVGLAVAILIFCRLSSISRSIKTVS